VKAGDAVEWSTDLPETGNSRMRLEQDEFSSNFPDHSPKAKFSCPINAISDLQKKS
jgi:hypothetical protein